MREITHFFQMEVLLRMILNQCIEVQTFPDERPSVPAWFAEVVMVAQHLATTGFLDGLARSASVWCVGASVAMNRLIFSHSCSGMRLAGNERYRRSLNGSLPLETPSWLCLGVLTFPIEPP
jgi:hypothetical protein